MKAILCHRWSDLDQVHEFGLQCDEPWVWFFLGGLISGRKIDLSPWTLLDSEMVPFEGDDAEELASRIHAQIRSYDHPQG